MKLALSKVDVWAAEVEDRPGSLAAKLAALKQAGANLQFVISRRAPDKEGAGVVFVTPIKGARQIRAAQGAWFDKTASLRCLCVQGPDRPGLGADLTAALAQAGLNLRGLTAAAVGKRFVMYVALDSEADLKKAIQVLGKA